MGLRLRPHAGMTPTTPATHIRHQVYGQLQGYSGEAIVPTGFGRTRPTLCQLHTWPQTHTRGSRLCSKGKAATCRVPVTLFCSGKSTSRDKQVARSQRRNSTATPTPAVTPRAAGHSLSFLHELTGAHRNLGNPGMTCSSVSPVCPYVLVGVNLLLQQNV